MAVDLENVDWEFEEIRKKQDEEVEACENEFSHVMDEVVETLNSTEVVESQEGVSMNHSGLVRIIRDCPMFLQIFRKYVNVQKQSRKYASRLASRLTSSVGYR